MRGKNLAAVVVLANRRPALTRSQELTNLVEALEEGHGNSEKLLRKIVAGSLEDVVRMSSNHVGSQEDLGRDNASEEGVATIAMVACLLIHMHSLRVKYLYPTKQEAVRKKSEKTRSS